MRKTILPLVVISFILVGSWCQAQTRASVPDPQLEIRDNRLHIYYEILGSEPKDEFLVKILVLDDEQKTVKATAFSGDVGAGIRGGSAKHAVWDYEADGVFINAYLSVVVQAEFIPPPAPVAEAPVAETPDDIPSELSPGDKPEEIVLKEQPVSREEAAGEKEFTRSVLLLQSAILPGLGLSRVTGNPHWIKGVAGYTCVAGAIVLNRAAVQEFSAIAEMEQMDDIVEAYDRSLRWDNVSEVLAYVAVGIWVSDLVWTFVGTSDLGGNSLQSRSAGCSLYTSWDPVLAGPLIGFRYRFKIK
jgi:hypothetical protein